MPISLLHEELDTVEQPRLEERASEAGEEAARVQGLKLGQAPELLKEQKAEEELRLEEIASEAAGRFRRPSAAIMEVPMPQEEWVTPAEWGAEHSEDEELRLDD